MTARLDISSAQITAICKGAAKANHVAEVKIGQTVIRLIPAVNAQKQRPIAKSGKTKPANLSEWREAQRESKTVGNP